MKYSDLMNAITKCVLSLIQRDERLAQLHKVLITEICIEKDKFEYDNMDNPAQVRNFFKENLSEEVKNAYHAIRAELSARYAITLPDAGD